MQIDTAGTYTLKYTAEDACGNVTEVTREVVAEAPLTYRTVLYTDGTLIINESSRDQATNEALHGAAYAVYDPMLEDGSNYVFSSPNDQPWSSGDARNTLQTVKFGSSVKPVSMAYWFAICAKLTSVVSANLDTSEVTDMSQMFAHTSTSQMMIQTLDLSTWDTSKVTNMSGMFKNCYQLDYLDASTWDTSSVTDMSAMFIGCLNLNHAQISQWDVSNVTTMENMFAGTYNGADTRTEIDLSGWNTSSVINTEGMFANIGSLVTIYASDLFVTSQVTASTNMFINNYALVGGGGTAYNYSHRNKSYARIDNPPSAPGYFTLKSA